MNVSARYRRPLFIALALLMGLAGGAALCELGIRVYLTRAFRQAIDDNPTHAPADPAAVVELDKMVYRVDNSKLGFRLKPHTVGVFHEVPIKLNSMGLRHREIPEAKPAGTLRVVVLGDSTMFGWGVAVGGRCVDILEVELQKAFGAERQVEVIPAAAPSWNAVQEIEFFHSESARLQPDAVVIQFDQNDTDVTFPRVHPTFLSARKIYLLRLRSLWKGTMLAEEAKDPKIARPLPEQSEEEKWAALREAYAQLSATCHERKIPLLACFTVRHDLSCGPDESFVDSRRYAKFRAVCAELKIDLIDPGHPDQLSKWPDPLWPGERCLYLPSDGHVGPKGHALIAAALFPELMSRLARERAEEAVAAFRRRMVNTLAPPAERGLWNAEDWGGIPVRWGQSRVRIPLEPKGKTLVIPYMISHPDVSPEKPVIVEFEFEGKEIARFEHKQGGYVVQKIPLLENQTHIDIKVNRAFREQNIARALAIAVYPIKYE